MKTAVKFFGLQEPWCYTSFSTMVLSGHGSQGKADTNSSRVVLDYHHKSLHEKVDQIDYFRIDPYGASSYFGQVNQGKIRIRHGPGKQSMRMINFLLRHPFAFTPFW